MPRRRQRFAAGECLEIGFRSLDAVGPEPVESRDDAGLEEIDHIAIMEAAARESESPKHRRWG
jgi:hypothetical protein